MLLLNFNFHPNLFLILHKTVGGFRNCANTQLSLLWEIYEQMHKHYVDQCTCSGDLLPSGVRSFLLVLVMCLRCSTFINLLCYAILHMKYLS